MREKTATIDQLIKEARILYDGSSNVEYLRGMSDLIAGCFGVEDIDSGDRSEFIQKLILDTEGKHITFEQFQNSKKYYDDLTKAPEGTCDDSNPANDQLLLNAGYMYAGGLYIYVDAKFKYSLVVGNCEFQNRDLEVLEEILYQYGIEEGII